MMLRSIFSLMCAVSTGFTQVPQGAEAKEAPGAPLPLTGFLLVARGEWGTSDWRNWVADKPTPTTGKQRQQSMPGATVEVVDSLFEMHKDRVRELNLRFTPVMVSAFRVGEGSSITAQMLSEFMSMHGANFHPPTLPLVWYNGLIPYWVQQGWSGSTVKAWAGQDQPILLYPKGR